MNRFLLALMAVLGPAWIAAAQAPPKPNVTVIPLAAKAAAAGPVMKYRLLPDPEELTPGNAAALWRQAYVAAREAKAPLSDKQFKWFANLKEIPVQEVRDYLDKLKPALRLADQAARRTTCDWDLPPLTPETISEASGLGEVQLAREIIAYLSFQCRLQLSEKKYDDAARTLQTGFALARHVGEAPILIQNLVSIAITAIMLGDVELWMQQPDAPNLYWALTALPDSFPQMRAAVEYELGTFLRWFPQLKQADKPGMTGAEAQKLLEEAVATMSKLGEPNPASGIMAKLSVAVMVPMYLGEAKKYLIAHGRKAEEVEALPPAQAVLIWYADQYVRERDEILKWFTLPPWQALPGLEERDKMEKELKKKVAGTTTLQGNWALRLLMPAVLKVFEANLRRERHVAAMRTAEAIRLYAAAHDGKLPKKLSDVTEAPLPVDPRTGQGFDEFYSVDGDKAVLEVPMMPNVLVRRYEFGPTK